MLQIGPTMQYVPFQLEVWDLTVHHRGDISGKK